MKHTKKVKQARKMLSGQERRDHTPIFDSKAWKNRRDARKAKELAKRT